MIRELVPSSHQRSELSNTIGGGIPIPDSLGEEATFINICINNRSLKCHRVLISTTPSVGGKIICWYICFNFKTFISSLLVTRDFCPRPRAPDVSASRRFGTKPLNTPRHSGTKTFRHQNISTQDGWMDGITYIYFNYMYYVRVFRSI